MATYTKFQVFVKNLAEKVHNLGSDTLMIALTNTAPNAATGAVLADITEIAYTNLSARTLTVSSSAQSAGTYSLKVNDLTLTASGAVATFRYVVIYNSTPTSPLKPLIGFFDYGASVTMQNSGETFVISFDQTNGLLQIS